MIRISSTVWALLAFILTCVPAIAFIPKFYLFEIINALVFSVACGVLVSWWAGFADSVQKPVREIRGADLLQLGVFVAWLATAGVFAILWIWRILGKSDAVIDSGVNAAARWGFVLAGLLHIAASGTVRGVVQRAGYVRVGMIVAAGFALALTAIMLTLRQ